MDREIILENLIKKNRGLLRRLTNLHNEIKDLKGRVLELEQFKKDFESSIKEFNRRGFEDIPGVEVNKKGTVVLMKAEGTDPD